MTPYDWLLFRRTAALGVALGLLLWCVMVATDEAGSSLASRLGKLAALVALAGGGAALLSTEQARSRGEFRALSALGVRPARAVLGAIAGGTLVGALGPALVLSGRSDLAELLPRIGQPSGAATWVVRGDGAFAEPARGLLVHASGALERVTQQNAVAIEAHAAPRAAILLTLALAACAFPLWATARGSAPRRAAVATSALAFAVAAFHLVAAERAPAALLILPPLIVLADGWALHRSPAVR